MWIKVQEDRKERWMRNGGWYMAGQTYKRMDKWDESTAKRLERWLQITNLSKEEDKNDLVSFKMKETHTVYLWAPTLEKEDRRREGVAREVILSFYKWLLEKRSDNRRGEMRWKGRSVWGTKWWAEKMCHYIRNEKKQWLREWYLEAIIWCLIDTKLKSANSFSVKT